MTPTHECCDPYKAGWVDSVDQLVPYLAVNIFKATPGAAGLYISGAFSGTLSTVSSGINSMSTCLITDLIRPNEKRLFGKAKSESFYTWMSKICSVAFGLLCIGFSYVSLMIYLFSGKVGRKGAKNSTRLSKEIYLFSYVAANLGGILQAALSINGMLGGPTFGLFLLAFFNPWSESIGAIVGYIVGIATGVWCYIGSKTYPPLPEFTKALPTEIIGCEGNVKE